MHSFPLKSNNNRPYLIILVTHFFFFISSSLCPYLVATTTTLPSTPACLSPASASPRDHLSSSHARDLSHQPSLTDPRDQPSNFSTFQRRDPTGVTSTPTRLKDPTKALLHCYSSPLFVFKKEYPFIEIFHSPNNLSALQVFIQFPCLIIEYNRRLKSTQLLNAQTCIIVHDV